MPVWKDRARCVAELKGSFTGSFSNPKIREAGRAFLASLLVQLSDAQLRDLFVNARVKRRSSNPSADPDKDGPLARSNEWVKAFKLKRPRSSTALPAVGRAGEIRPPRPRRGIRRRHSVRRRLARRDRRVARAPARAGRRARHGGRRAGPADHSAVDRLRRSG